MMHKHEIAASKSERKDFIEDRVRDRAYELYLERLSLERDMDDGNAEEDWLRAEQEITASPKLSRKAA